MARSVHFQAPLNKFTCENCDDHGEDHANAFINQAPEAELQLTLRISTATFARPAGS